MAINMKALLAQATSVTRERADELIAEDMAKAGYTARYGPFKDGTVVVEGIESLNEGSRRRNASKKIGKSKLFKAAFGDVKEGAHMSQSVRGSKTDAELKDARAEHFIHVAVVAAILVEPKGVDAFLDIDDAELGRAFKNHLWKAAGIASVHGIDLPSLRDEAYKLQGDARRHEKQSASRHEHSNAETEKDALVRQGKMLSLEDFRKATGITEKKLQKDLVARRLFVVVIGAEAYVPSLFLSGLFERKAMAKVLRRIEELSGWEKYLFLTTALGSQADATPLQLLAAGLTKQALNAADEIGKCPTLERPDSDGSMSTVEAAKFLFVSRRHVVKLIDEGKLEIHHKVRNNRFVTKKSVFEYQASQEEAIQAYQASKGDEE